MKDAKCFCGSPALAPYRLCKPHLGEHIAKTDWLARAYKRGAHLIDGSTERRQEPDDEAEMGAGVGGHATIRR